jgi:3-oxoacyl-[acyl-carrier protein] reductase
MNQIDLKQRSAIVTGGAQGIGLAIVKRMLASGASVRIWDRDQKLLQQTLSGLSGAVSGDAVDVADEQSIVQGTAAAIKALGKIDILVNNAGIAGANAPTVDYPVDEWERVIRINLTSQFLTCRSVVPHMVKQKYGRIVNIASVAGKEGNPNAVAYSASKAGVISLTKSLGKELATSGVSVNCITPAAAKTAIFDQMTEQHINYMLSKIPMGRFVQVDEVAALACWLASEDCSFSTAAVFDVTGGRSTY